MELSRQTYHFICFELLRLRTRYDNEKDNTVKVRIAKRYRKVRKEFDSRGSQWIPSEHELDRIINTVEIIEKERKYSKKQCMRCKKAPEVEALWAEGMGHVWFCKEHYEEWKKDEFELNGKMLTYGSEVNTEREIDGEASEKWSEPIKKQEGEEGGGKWVTLEGGQKVFIREGESFNEAVGRLKPSEEKPKNYKVTSIKPEASKKIEGYLSELPEEHTKDLKIDSMGMIDFNIMRGMVGESNPHGEVAAFYIQGENNIIIRESLVDTAYGKAYIHHEVGHHVWKNMDGEDLRSFNEVFKANPNGLPNDYARTSVDEGFAEAYNTFQSNGFSVKDSDQKPYLEWFYKHKMKKGY